MRETQFMRWHALHAKIFWQRNNSAQMNVPTAKNRIFLKLWIIIIVTRANVIKRCDCFFCLFILMLIKLNKHGTLFYTTAIYIYINIEMKKALLFASKNFALWWTCLFYFVFRFTQPRLVLHLQVWARENNSDKGNANIW